MTRFSFGEEASLPDTTDPVALTQMLIREPSVSPDTGAAQALLAAVLEQMGFKVWHLTFGEGKEKTFNFFARRGDKGPHICFAGHTDVVPPGKEELWTHPPYAAHIADGVLYGRGACDMKGGIAAFVAAASRMGEGGPGSVSLLITGDEEGRATYGTQKVLEWMAQEGHIPDYCVVGEPTNPLAIGDMIKNGRRGSLNAHIVVEGVQGHVAYPHRADNPVHRLLALLGELTARPLDEGSEWFEASSLQVTSMDVGNTATNVIPAKAEARLNIRFNNLHTGAELARWITTVCQKHAPQSHADIHISGESFLTPPGAETRALISAIRQVTGRDPKQDTGGGTSDARFIARYCPAVEFGLVGASIHQVDEHTSVQDLETLTQIYHIFLKEVLA